MEGDRAVEETPDFGGAVDIEEEADVNMLLRPKPETQAESTIVVNPQFCSKKYKQWVDLLALSFIRSNQRRPDDPGQVYRLGESEGDRFPEPKSEVEEPDTSDDDIDVTVNGKYDGSVTPDGAFGGFKPVITAFMQGEEAGALHASVISLISSMLSLLVRSVLAQMPCVSTLRNTLTLLFILRACLLALLGGSVTCLSPTISVGEITGKWVGSACLFSMQSHRQRCFHRARSSFG